MYDEDQAPVTLSEIYNQADSCRHTAGRSRVLEHFLPPENYSDIVITGCGSSHNLAMCASFAWSEILERPVIAVASSELALYAHVGRLLGYWRAAARVESRCASSSGAYRGVECVMN